MPGTSIACAAPVVSLCDACPLLATRRLVLTLDTLLPSPTVELEAPGSHQPGPVLFPGKQVLSPPYVNASPVCTGSRASGYYLTTWDMTVCYAERLVASRLCDVL
eukprot:3709588-Rhodomonas_salina.4